MLNNNANQFDVNINSHKITNVSNPTSLYDVANKNYIDSVLSNYQTASQVTYLANVSISNFGAVNTNQLNNLTLQNILTSNPNTADVNINNHKIINVSNPTNIYDVSNKNYVDTAITNLNSGSPAGLQTYNQVQNSITASLNGCLPKYNPTVTGILNTTNIDTASDLGIGASSSSITIGSGINGCVITIGGPNDVINLIGKTNNIQTTNSQISNKTITLNEGETGNNQSGSCGIQIRDNSTDNQGYILTDSTSTQFLLKPPQNANIFKITSTPSDNYDLSTVLSTNNLINSSLTSYSTTTQTII